MPYAERAAVAVTVRRYVPLVAAALFVSWLAAFAWWALSPQARTVSLDIPSGTAVQVAAGEVPGALPDRLFVRVGDTLAVHNSDSIAYRVGPTFTAPGSWSRVRVTSAFFAGSTILCSFHPSGALEVVPRAQPSLLWTVPIALIAGLPLAIAAAAVLHVAYRLDATDDARATT